MNGDDSHLGLQLQLQGVAESEIADWLSQLQIDDSQYAISSQSQISGESFVNLLLKLSDIELDALSLLVGYLIARGVRVSQFISGIARQIVDLEDAKAMIREIDAESIPNRAKSEGQTKKKREKPTKKKSPKQPAKKKRNASKK